MKENKQAIPGLGEQIDNHYNGIDSSFYGLTSVNFKDLDSSMNKQVVAMGFSMSSGRKIQMIPVGMNDGGIYIVLKPERQENLNAFEFFDYLLKKYGVFSVFIDRAYVYSFHYGFSNILNTLSVETLITPVKDIYKKLCIVNDMFRENTILDNELRIIKSYIAGTKYQNKMKYEISEISEAVIDALVGLDQLFTDKNEFEQIC